MTKSRKVRKTKTRRSSQIREDKRLLLVLGMHRSGTSLVAGTLHKLGFQLGDSLLPAASDNPKGFFENVLVVQTHRRLLEELGLDWHDPSPLPDDWMSDPETDAVVGELAAELGRMATKGHDVAVKDPRASRLVPLWSRVAEEVNYSLSTLIVVRDPLEVIASLAKRDRIDYFKAALLWLRYMLDAERNSRGIPRAFVKYDMFLEDWRAEIDRVSDVLGMQFAPSIEQQEDIDGFVDPELRHQSDVEPPREHVELARLLSDAYQTFASLCVNNQSPPLSSDFEHLQDRMDAIMGEYIRSLLLERNHRHHLSEAMVLLRMWQPNRILREPAFAKVYWRCEDEHYAEERSIGRLVQEREDGFHARFALPAGARTDFLRFDPDEVPGVYVIRAIRMGTRPVARPDRLVVAAHELRLPAVLQGTVRIASLAEDPFIEFDLRGLAEAAGARSLLLHFQRETLAQLLENQVAAIDEATAVQAEHIDTRLQAQHEQQTRQFAVGRDMLEELQRGMLSRLDAFAATERASTAALTAELASVRHELEVGLQQRLSLLEASRVRHEAVTGELASVRHELEVGLQQRLALLESSRVRHEALTAELASVRHELEVGAEQRLSLLEASRVRHEAVTGELVLVRRELEVGAEQRLSLLEASRVRHEALLAQLSPLNVQLDALVEDVRSLRVQQALILEWAKRRSPRYWWSRFKGAVRQAITRRGNHRLEVHAFQNVLSLGQANGQDIWQAQNDDPQFLLGGDDIALPGGWHLLDVHFTQLDENLRLPCLYPDYGNGIHESDRVPLPQPDKDGRLRAVVLLKYPVNRLRFDPTTRSATFTLGDVQLRPIGRVEALARMAAGIRASAGSWRRAIPALLPIMREVAKGRTRHAGESAYTAYLECHHSSSDQYGVWTRSFDTPTPEELERMRQDVQEMSSPPLISIAMPVYQTPERWLRRCIDSVLAQIYPHWELCIADDASPSPHVRRVLNEYMERDARIRVLFRAENGHISAASNSALELVQGKYVALLDHDDELPPHALYEIAKTAQAHPEWRLIYTDEDKIDEKGRRFDPYFKPDWNYELFLAQNYLCHLCVYDAKIIDEIGGFRIGLEGSQDWDLALRGIELLKPHEIGHIAKVLYHWRAIPGSTAMGVAQKDYARKAGWRAVTDHLQRLGIEARVEVAESGYMHIKRKVTTPIPKVSLLIPTRDKVELLRMCVRSILEKTDYPDYEIIIVDNQSEEVATLKYLEELSSQPQVKVLRYEQPFNYSAINNFAAAFASGSIIGLVNNDVEVISFGWMREMTSQAVRPEIGVVGAMLLYPNDTIQHAGVILGIGGIAGHPFAGLPANAPGARGRAQLAQELSAVTAACLFVRKSVFDQVGGLDEHLSVAFNDIDFCLRVRAEGYRNLWTPYARLYHHESASRGYEDTPEKLARFKSEVDFMRARWGDSLLRDPAYNPNLSLDNCYFDLAFPPRQTMKSMTDLAVDKPSAWRP